MSSVISSKCEACGRVFTYERAAGGGRPRVYCDDTCGRWAVVAVQLLGLLAEMRARMTPEVWLRLRQQLWAELNARPWNRGVPRTQAEGMLARLRR